MNVSALNKRLSDVEKRASIRSVQHIEILDDYKFRLLRADLSVYRTYTPVPTALELHKSNAFVRLIMGPFGSGKSTATMADVVMRACAMPLCVDGVRRLKAVFIRNTSGELETSTLATWNAWFSELGDIKSRQKPILTRHHTFNDQNGKVELSITFLACDRDDDVKKLKSTEYTIAYLNEANELPEALMQIIKGRVNGRYPSKTMCPEPYFTGVLMDTNPPSTSHWMYKTFEVDKPENYIIFKQPPGLIKSLEMEGKWIANLNADNMINLRQDYYTKMADGADEEFIKVYCNGEYGLIMTGKPVYNQYNDDLHAVEDIEIEKGYPIVVGFDFGLTPACTIEQYVNGQLRTIKEFVSDFNTDFQSFISDHVYPWITANCEGMSIECYYDPSDPKGQAIGVSPSQILADFGLRAYPSSSNRLLPRLDAVRFFLGRLSNGKPAYILSKKGCPVLRKGFYGEYKYRTIQSYGEKIEKEEPNKTHPISDVHDAHQYVALSIHAEINVPQTDKKNMYADIGGMC
jgi:Phage terminase large subunit